MVVISFLFTLCFFGIISHFKISSCRIIIDEARTCETQLSSPPPWLLSSLLAGSILRILHTAVPQPQPQPLPLAPAVSFTLHTKAFNGKFDKHLRFTQTPHLVTMLLSLRQLESITFSIQKGQNFKWTQIRKHYVANFISNKQYKIWIVFIKPPKRYEKCNIRVHWRETSIYHLVITYFVWGPPYDDWLTCTIAFNPHDEKRKHTC